MSSDRRTSRGGSEADRVESYRVVVLGGGMSGICMGVKLREAGIEDFVILEKADAVGGTWRENTYPGVACDVPSHLYSYSFELNPNWSHFYSSGAEIWAYCEAVVEKYGLAPHLRFVVGWEQRERSERVLRRDAP